MTLLFKFPGKGNTRFSQIHECQDDWNLRVSHRHLCPCFRKLTIHKGFNLAHVLRRGGAFNGQLAPEDLDAVGLLVGH